MVQLAGCRAIVVGATSGIGKALALSLAEEGADLCLTGRQESKLEQLKQEIGSKARVDLCLLELSDPIRVESVGQELARTYPQVDILALVAGELKFGRLEEVTNGHLDRVLSVNLKAPWLLVKQLRASLVACKGQIVFVNSSIVFTGARSWLGAYAASKFALKAVADSVRDELNVDGVRVLSIYPGRTATPMQEAVFAKEQRTYNPMNLLQPQDVARCILGNIMLPRSAEVSDVQIGSARKF